MDLLQYNKKINFDVYNKRRIIFLEEISFLCAINVFSKCFEIKYSRNLLGLKYDLTMVTFNSCADTRQISDASNSRRYLVLLVTFGKWWVLKHMDCVFWCEIALLSVSFAFSRKCHAVCLRYTIIPRQRDTGYAIILFYQNWFFDSNSWFS